MGSAEVLGLPFAVLTEGLAWGSSAALLAGTTSPGALMGAFLAKSGEIYHNAKTLIPDSAATPHIRLSATSRAGCATLRTSSADVRPGRGRRGTSARDNRVPIGASATHRPTRA